MESFETHFYSVSIVFLCGQFNDNAEDWNRKNVHGKRKTLAFFHIFQFFCMFSANIIKKLRNLLFRWNTCLLFRCSRASVTMYEMWMLETHRYIRYFMEEQHGKQISYIFTNWKIFGILWGCLSEKKRAEEKKSNVKKEKREQKKQRLAHTHEKCITVWHLMLAAQKKMWICRMSFWMWWHFDK